MAFEAKSNPETRVVSGNGRQSDPAIAWINCQVKDKEGGMHRLNQGIPLTGATKLERTLLSLLDSRGSETLDLELVGTLRRVDTDPDSLLEVEF